MAAGTTEAVPDSMIVEKAGQVSSILQETGVDLWLIFVRETEGLHDPTLDVVVGTDVTWESAMLFSASGRRIA
jgi:hypothetical protein